MKRPILVVVMTLLVIGAAVIGFFAYIDYREKTYQPKLFSLDNPKAGYSIGKSYGLYTVKYDEEHNKKRDVSTWEVLVGTSRVELENYVGKNVRIAGRFPDKWNKQQCIVDTCTPINAVSIDIDSVEEIK